MGMGNESEALPHFPGGRVQPSSIPERSVADANSADYLFFGAISFIFEVCFCLVSCYFLLCFLLARQTGGACVVSPCMPHRRQLQMKTGPFFEHSRYLYDMSAVQEWKKVCVGQQNHVTGARSEALPPLRQQVNTGLIKMYKGEVLLKFPVIQHFLFGSILPLDLPEAPASTPTQNVGVGDMHPSMTGRMPPAGRMPPPGKVPPTAFPHARPK